MLLILAKYGIPNTVICMIKKLYLKCFVQLKLGETMCEIDYKTGVQQGENMAPIIFLFIMQAAIESLHPKLICNIPNFKYFQPKKMLQNNYMEDSASNQSTSERMKAPSKLITCFM